MYKFNYSAALVFALFLPFLAAASTPCDCDISKDLGVIKYSVACYTPETVCSITLEEALGDIDLYQFVDLREVEITIGDGTHPNFSASALVSAGTHFRVLGNNVNIDMFSGASLSNTVQGTDGGNSINAAMVNLSAFLCLDIDIDLYLLGSGDLTTCTLAGSIVMPVTLLTYTAEAGSSGVDIEWTTADETDNDYFRVLHAANGGDFVPIATLTGNGTTGESTDYRFTHRYPAAGQNYYRVEQVDYDGTKTDLGVRTVNWTATDLGSLTIYPNPSTQGEAIRIALPGHTEPTTAQLHDLTGRRLGEIAVAAGASVTLPGTLVPGMYTLTVDQSTARLVVTD